MPGTGRGWAALLSASSACDRYSTWTSFGFGAGRYGGFQGLSAQPVGAYMGAVLGMAVREKRLLATQGHFSASHRVPLCGAGPCRVSIVLSLGLADAAGVALRAMPARSACRFWLCLGSGAELLPMLLFRPSRSGSFTVFLRTRRLCGYEYGYAFNSGARPQRHSPSKWHTLYGQS